MAISKIRAKIKKAVEAEGVYCTPENKIVADASIRETLGHISEFATQVSEELMLANLHSEAMVAGIISQKARMLRDEL